MRYPVYKILFPVFIILLLAPAERALPAPLDQSLLTWIEQRKYTKAEQTLTKILKTRKGLEDRYRFWLGFILIKKGKFTEAQ